MLAGSTPLPIPRHAATWRYARPLSWSGDGLDGGAQGGEIARAEDDAIARQQRRRGQGPRPPARSCASGRRGPGRSSTSTTTTSRSRVTASCEIASECFAASACGTRMWSSARLPDPIHVAAAVSTPASRSRRRPRRVTQGCSRSRSPSRTPCASVASLLVTMATGPVVSPLGVRTHPWRALFDSKSGLAGRPPAT